MILPAAPKNFYTPSLQEIKNVLESVNGTTKGQLTLITGVPELIEESWNDVGSGSTLEGGTTTGRYVVGVSPLSSIGDIVAGTVEDGDEYGYKIVIDSVEDIQIYIDGSGTTTANVIGMALIVGRDVFNGGTDSDVRYIGKLPSTLVTDGGQLTLKPWEIQVNYATAV